MNERQIDELLNFLSRIASAVEALAVAAKPDFHPDYSRAIKQRERMIKEQREVRPGEPKSGE